MTTAADRYHARMRRVLDHVEAHLDGDLSLEALAAVAAFSKHHFHRQFAELTGVGVYRYVQLARLKRAAHQLAFRRERPVLQVALDSGYEGPEAFARAFRQRLGQTPSDFRRSPDWPAWADAYQAFEQTRSAHMSPAFSDDQVRIVDFPDTPVAVMRHLGPPERIGETVRRFIAWRRAAGCTPPASATFNLWWDNPEDTPPEAFRMDLCAGAAQVAPNAAGVESGVIPAGRCALLRHRGIEAGLKAALRFLYADWLPRSGEEPGDFPLFFQRLQFFPDVPEAQAVTDIFLPLR